MDSVLDLLSEKEVTLSGGSRRGVVVMCKVDPKQEGKDRTFVKTPTDTNFPFLFLSWCCFVVR